MESKIANHPDVCRAFADEFEKKRKVGRIFLASDEKVVDVLATTQKDPVWRCCSCSFWYELIRVCWVTCCFLCTCFIDPKWQCKWNIHRENLTTVLVLTNRRLICYKESDGSPSLKNPQRYTHQQIHLSGIGQSESHYAQALPGLCARLFMLCGCCTLCCHSNRQITLKFQTKYKPPAAINRNTVKSEIANLYESSKFVCDSPFAIFAFMWRCICFAFKMFFVQPGLAILRLNLVKPSTETILFEEELSQQRDRIENLPVESMPNDIKRYDAFYKNFNLFRSQYSDASKIPPLHPDSFQVEANQTWEQAYDQAVDDGDRIFVNSFSTGFITGKENVIEAIDVTYSASIFDWIKCCWTCCCYYCGFISPLKRYRQFFVFTNYRAIKLDNFSGRGGNGKYGVMNAYIRTVTSYYDCVPTKGARFEQTECILCTCCACSACCNKPVSAMMEFSNEFGVFKLSVESRKDVYPKIRDLFSHMVKYFECKNSFTAEKLGPHVAQHHSLSNRQALFSAECNSSGILGKSLKDVAEPLTRSDEPIHAGVYQYGDWAMSGNAGGQPGFCKKYICPDKFWWHSALVVTENKVVSYYNKNSSAERRAFFVITMLPADKIKASSFHHTAQSFSYKCFECCFKLKNLTGSVVLPADPRELFKNIEDHHFGIMRAEIHLGTGAPHNFNLMAPGATGGTKAPKGDAAASSGPAAPTGLPFFGAELSNHSAGKKEVPQEVTAKEIELERLYAVLSSISYLALEKGIKNEITDIPAMVPSYNSTPIAANPQ